MRTSAAKCIQILVARKYAGRPAQKVVLLCTRDACLFQKLASCARETITFLEPQTVGPQTVGPQIVGPQTVGPQISPRLA